MVYTQRDIHPSWGWVYQVGLDGRAAFCRQAGFSSQRLLCKHVVCASMLFGRLIRDLQVELGPLGVDCVSLGRSSPADDGGCVFFLPVIRLFHLWSGLIITSAAKHPIFATWIFNQQVVDGDCSCNESEWQGDGYGGAHYYAHHGSWAQPRMGFLYWPTSYSSVFSSHGMRNSSQLWTLVFVW